MAFTVTMLSWSVIEYRQQIADAGELEHAMEAIKWGTDYFIKAHTSPNVLWAEVINQATSTKLIYCIPQLAPECLKYLRYCHRWVMETLTITAGSARRT
jgi:hypothetical protein